MLDDTNKTVPDVDTTGNGNIAKHVEDNLCKSFHCHSVKDMDKAMDLYQMANQQQQSQHTHHRNSSNTHIHNLHNISFISFLWHHK
jgi:hypothetical protein